MKIFRSVKHNEAIVGWILYDVCYTNIGQYFGSITLNKNKYPICYPSINFKISWICMWARRNIHFLCKPLEDFFSHYLTLSGCSWGASSRSLLRHRSISVNRPVLPVAWASAYTTSWKIIKTSWVYTKGENSLKTNKKLIAHQTWQKTADESGKNNRYKNIQIKDKHVKIGNLI